MSFQAIELGPKLRNVAPGQKGFVTQGNVDDLEFLGKLPEESIIRHNEVGNMLFQLSVNGPHPATVASQLDGDLRSQGMSPPDGQSDMVFYNPEDRLIMVRWVQQSPGLTLLAVAAAIVIGGGLLTFLLFRGDDDGGQDEGFFNRRNVLILGGLGLAVALVGGVLIFTSRRRALPGA